MISAAEIADIPPIEALMRLTIEQSVDANATEKRIFFDNSRDNLLLWSAHPHRCVHLKYSIGADIAGVILVKDYWNLCSLFVHPARQNAGIGRALLDAAIEACRYKSERPAMRLNAARNAIGFYEAMGFSRIRSRGASLGVTPMEYVFEA